MDETQPISLSLSRLEGLLKENNYSILQAFAVERLKFIEVKSPKYAIIFFVAVPSRFNLKGEPTFDVTKMYDDAVPEYKRSYINLLEGVAAHGGATSRAFVMVSRDSLCHISGSGTNTTSYSFDEAQPSTPHTAKATVKDNAIRSLESQIETLRHDSLKVSSDYVTFIESTPDDPADFELYDYDGTEIDRMDELLVFSPKPVHLKNGKIAEYRPKEDNTIADVIPVKLDENNELIPHLNPRADVKTVLDSSINTDIGEIYSCLDIDTFFILLKDHTLEDKLIKEYEEFRELEVRHRDTELEEIDKILNEFKLRVMRSIEAVRESEDEIKVQIQRLLKILSSCHNVSNKIKAQDEEKLVEVEKRTKRTLDELTVELASKRDEINAILSEYKKRVNRVLQ